MLWLHHSGWYIGNTKQSCFKSFFLTERTDVVVNLIAGDVWGSEDELTGAFSDKVEMFGLTIFVKFSNVFSHDE